MLAEATFVVLVTPSKDVQGQWVAHCLNIDVVTQGDSIQHAFAMAREAVMQVVEDDLAHGFDPLERPDADESCWRVMQQTVRQGRPLTGIADFQKVKAAIGYLSIVVPNEALPEHARPAEVEIMPPAWQIAALADLRNASCSAH